MHVDMSIGTLYRFVQGEAERRTNLKLGTKPQLNCERCISLFNYRDGQISSALSRITGVCNGVWHTTMNLCLAGGGGYWIVMACCLAAEASIRGSFTRH